MSNLEWQLEFLNLLKNLEFIQDVEPIATPSDVEADLAVLISVDEWKGEYTRKVSKIVTELVWKVQKETGTFISIYFDWKEVAPQLTR